MPFALEVVTETLTRLTLSLLASERESRPGQCDSEACVYVYNNYVRAKFGIDQETENYYAKKNSSSCTVQIDGNDATIGNY